MFLLQYQLAGNTWLVGGSGRLGWCWKIVSHISNTWRDGEASRQRNCEGTATAYHKQLLNM